jgi:PAS domain S-box-containing protein
MNGKFLENFEYEVEGTACADVVEDRKLIHIPDRLVELYAGRPELSSLKAVSYLGVPLLDTRGEVMGHLSVMDSKPLPADPRLISIFEIFASRAAAEQRRLRREMEVRAREEELSALLNSAMDAVVVLDPALCITRVNPAAERLFGCTAEDLLAENVRDFLAADSVARLETFVRELESRPEGQRQLWIPQSFTANRWDRSAFPAEATLSRFENRGKTFYTLIVRNVNERIEAERQIDALTAETEYLREEIRELQNFDEILGQSTGLRRVLEDVQQVAPTDAVVLLEGETGTGKELFARAIHAASKRHDQPMVTVNCAAIPATLMESEFFGHEKGAFTGATVRREGRFALADGGTLFLDEVGELPIDLQGKLLRVLQEGTFEPVGGSVTRRADVRIVAATNRDLQQEAKAGRFREDLYYRLNVFPIKLPPLRERVEDIPVLAEAFAKRFARRMGRKLAALTADDVRRLQACSWPGNVRELENVIERAVIIAQAGRLNLDRALPQGGSQPETIALSKEEPGIRTVREMEELERENIHRALESADWRVSGQSGAASLLGMKPSTLNSRIKALGIQRP